MTNHKGSSAQPPQSIADLRSCAGQHLDAYTDPKSQFAFSTYDRIYGSGDIFTPLDCFAANLLSMRLGHRDVIPLFAAEKSAAVRLRNAMQTVLDNTTAKSPSFLDLQSIDEDPFTLLRAANFATENVKGWKAVGVCKTLHRLRPTLVPLYDSVVRNFYQTGDNPPKFFTTLHHDLRANRQWLEKLIATRTTPDGRPLSTLRAADIIIWHHQKIGGCKL